MADVWFLIAVSGLVALSVAVSLLLGVWLFVKIAGSRIDWLRPLYEDLRPRLRFFVFSIALTASVWAADLPEELWWIITTQSLVIVLILSGGFLVQEVVNYLVGRFIHRFEQGDQNDADVRRISTQLTVIRRLANVIIAVVAIGLALFTLPQVQAVGAGLLASAGVLSVIGGLAAQSVLGNLFAGIQLAFSNAVRVGDVVVVEGEWGTIGEITLSYVVVYIWDERRLIVPSTYFTTKTFETWTRSSPRVLGTVFMDLDWRVPLDAVRTEFTTFVTRHPLWDKRVSSVVVTDARGGLVQVRFLISAQNSSEQWDLRCQVREHMVAWLQREHPKALPTSRVVIEETPSQSTTKASGRT
jgi:small-conductance mechanosensitive channel